MNMTALEKFDIVSQFLKNQSMGVLEVPWCTGMITFVLPKSMAVLFIKVFASFPCFQVFPYLQYTLKNSMSFANKLSKKHAKTRLNLIKYLTNTGLLVMHIYARP